MLLFFSLLISFLSLLLLPFPAFFFWDHPWVTQNKRKNGRNRMPCCPQKNAAVLSIIAKEGARGQKKATQQAINISVQFSCAKQPPPPFFSLANFYLEFLNYRKLLETKGFSENEEKEETEWCSNLHFCSHSICVLLTRERYFFISGYKWKHLFKNTWIKFYSQLLFFSNLSLIDKERKAETYWVYFNSAQNSLRYRDMVRKNIVII